MVRPTVARVDLQARIGREAGDEIYRLQSRRHAALPEADVQVDMERTRSRQARYALQTEAVDVCLKRHIAAHVADRRESLFGGMEMPDRDFVTALFDDVLDSVLDDGNYAGKYSFDRHVFQKLLALDRSNPGSVARFFQDHPGTQDRIDDISGRISRMSRTSGIVDDPEYQVVRRRLGF